MKISIITAVCNNHTEIKNAIGSVLSQTYPGIEYIIVDGASTDGTKGIIESYGNKVSKYIYEKDNGIYDALNKGISIATGDVIGILHSDDIFENKDVISQVAQTFEKYDADGVYGDLIYVSKDSPEKIIRFWKSAPFKISMIEKGWMPPHTTLFLKRNLFEKFGNYNTRFKIAADYDFMLRILNKPELKFIYLPQVITRMRVGGASNRNLKNILQKSREDLLALRVNKIGSLWTLFLKNFSKLKQFFQKETD